MYLFRLGTFETILLYENDLVIRFFSLNIFHQNITIICMEYQIKHHD